MYRIFIVEDDAVIASAVEGHLRSWGWDARCAGDFGNILAEFAAFDPQLVLMDISLPSYNGYHWWQARYARFPGSRSYSYLQPQIT